MTHISQHIHEAFPADADLISQLKIENAHFQHLAAQFAAIDEEIARGESGEAPATDARLESLKKQRLALLDEIAPIVATARHG